MKTIAAVIAAFAVAMSAGAQPVADHLKCYKAKDNTPKAVYTANLDGLTPETGCRIKVPAATLCVQATKTNVTPTPPGGGPSGTAAGNFLCYKVKCPKGTLGAVTGTDQFGNHTVQPSAPKMLCAPFTITGGGPTTTTPVSTTTTTTIVGCISDNQACSTNASCCSGTCTGGTCTPLTTACLTLGNTCTQNGDCCSQLCQGGACAASSYCRQTNDACSVDSDCCSASCMVASGASLGTCAAPANGATCSVDGTVCTLGGTCGAGCCSGLCAPYAPTGVAVCQPASGCHVAGDSCTQDTDCCGGPGLPGGSGTPVTCAITPPATTGFCRNPIGCKPDGALCKLATQSCNASCDCCSGNCDNQNTCNLDAAGVPRCTGTTCVPAGGACASSANCCEKAPCVPNPSGTPPFVCEAPTTCPTGNSCVINDPTCCTGTRCTTPPLESMSGTCATCNASGQVCTADADCCPGTRCAVAVGSTQGTCTP